MKITILLLASFLIFSCNSYKKKTLKKERICKRIFTKREIKDLDKVLLFFDTQICNNEKTKFEEVEDCYKNFFLELEKTPETGELIIGIPIEEQEEFLKSIDKNLFNEIWIKKNFIYNRNRTIDKKRVSFPDTLNRLEFNINGKYISFLQELGDRNKKIKWYHKNVSKFGDISSNLFADVLMGYRNYNIKDKKIRLVIAIHYLTLNKEYDEMKKSDFRLKEKN